MYANYSVPIEYLNSEICDYAHANGMKVKTWTANTEETVKNSFEMGADCIITDVAFA